jgi:hypothetical protein
MLFCGGVYMNGNGRGGRREMKYLISPAEYALLESRVRAVLRRDANAGPDGYFIRSVYFDDFNEKAYHQKLAGVSDRKKYRLRSYDNNPGYIALECKEKHNRQVEKFKASVDVPTCEALLAGDFSPLANRDEMVCESFCAAARAEGLRPSVTVDYRREAFVYPASNFRITFDKNLRVGLSAETPMFDDNRKPLVTLPVFTDGSVILEIKYDGYMPEFARALIPPSIGVSVSVSKYCLCKSVYKSLRA